MSDEVVCLGCGLPYREGASDASSCGCAAPEARTVACPSCGGSLRVGARACPYCRCTVATTRCGRCAAWNLSAAQFCQACATALAGAAASERASGGDCPRCGPPLAPRVYGDLDVDECDGCGGLFVEKALVDRLIRSRDQLQPLHLLMPKRVAERRSETGYLRCPACEVLMNRKVFGRCSGVVVDVCREHGVWFDAGELSDVVAFLERGGWRKTEEGEEEDKRRRDQARLTLAAMREPLSSEHPRDALAWGNFATDLAFVLFE